MRGRPSPVLLASLLLAGCAEPTRVNVDTTLRCETSPYAWLRRPHGAFPGITAAACDALTHATFAISLAVPDTEELRSVDVAGDGVCHPFAADGWPAGSCVAMVRDGVRGSATILVYTPASDGALALRHAEAIERVEDAEVRVVPLFERAVPHLELVLTRDRATTDELLLAWTRDGWSPVLAQREIDGESRIVRASGSWETPLGPAPTRRRRHARFEERCSDHGPCEHRSAETWEDTLVWSDEAAAFAPAGGTAPRDETTARLLAVPPGRPRMDVVARAPPEEALPEPAARSTEDDAPRGVLEAFEDEEPCAHVLRVWNGRVFPPMDPDACERARALAYAPEELPLRLDPDTFRLAATQRAEPTGRCLPVRFVGWPETTCLVAGISTSTGWLGVYVPTEEGHRLAHLHVQHVRSHFRVSLEPFLADQQTLVVVDHWAGSGTGASFSSLSAFSMAPEGLRQVVDAPLRGLWRYAWERLDRSTLPRWEAMTTDRPRLVLDHVRASWFCPELTDEGKCGGSWSVIAGWREVLAWNAKQGMFERVERGAVPAVFVDAGE